MVNLHPFIGEWRMKSFGKRVDTLTNSNLASPFRIIYSIIGHSYDGINYSELFLLELNVWETIMNLTHDIIVA